MKMTTAFPLLLAAMLLAACAGPSKTTVDPGADVGAVDRNGATSSGVREGGIGSGTELGGGALGGPTASQENRVVYFDYDRFDVKAEYNEVLQAHARYLAGNPAARVRLEGHGDERGSREYNIGLGERRAQSVRNVLLLQGVSSDQIATVSFGEERPAVIGSDDEAWALNRRVELVYGQ